VTGVTCAINRVVLVWEMLVELAASAVVVPTAAGATAHLVTRLYASTEPKPVARSYPGPAVYPKEPEMQPVVPRVQGTMLSPAVMSWKTPVVVCARL
jgi:hypothetical protein